MQWESFRSSDREQRSARNLPENRAKDQGQRPYSQQFGSLHIFELLNSVTSVCFPCFHWGFGLTVSLTFYFSCRLEVFILYFKSVSHQPQETCPEFKGQLEQDAVNRWFIKLWPQRGCSASEECVLVVWRWVEWHFCHLWTFAELLPVLPG